MAPATLKQVSDTVYAFFDHPATISVALLTTLAVVIVFLVWIISITVRGGFQMHVVSDKLLDLAASTTIKSSTYPKMINGAEWGVSFWVYLRDISDSRDTVLTAPGLFSVVSVKASFELELGEGRKAVDLGHVSRRKWVQISVILHDDMVTVFKNGEIYRIEQVRELAIQDLNVDMIVGSPTSTIDGFMSNVAVSNHFPSTREMKRSYSSGPAVSNWFFRALGIGGVGFRSPVYRLA